MNTPDDDAPTGYDQFLRIIDNLPVLVEHQRRRKGLSLRAAALEIGMSLNTLRRLEQCEGDLQLNNFRLVIEWLRT